MNKMEYKLQKVLDCQNLKKLDLEDNQLDKNLVR